jgi:predicted transcriptional regulator
MTKNPTKTGKRRRSGAKKLRDTTVIAKAMAGGTTVEIAKEMGLTRQTVSEILNSDEVKAKVAEIDARLAVGIEDAIATILREAKTDPNVAMRLLQNFGAMGTKVKHTHDGTLTLEQLIGGAAEEGGNE